MAISIIIAAVEMQSQHTVEKYIWEIQSRNTIEKKTIMHVERNLKNNIRGILVRNAEEGATLGIGLDPPNVFLMHLTLHHPHITGGETSLFYHISCASL